MFRSLKVLRLLGLKVKQTVFQLIEANFNIKRRVYSLESTVKVWFILTGLVGSDQGVNNRYLHFVTGNTRVQFID